MQIHCDGETDLLYMRFDDRKQQVINKRLSEDIALNVGDDDKIIGIEVLDASKRVNLSGLPPIEYDVVSSEAK